MIPISIQGLRKHFGTTRAVDGIDLEIGAGDLFFLLGPSGCGKTTLLRMLAGFTDPTDGRILFGERNVTHEAANKRDTGMVFQGYALWPHMTVKQNVEFGLTVGKRKGKYSAADRKVKVDDALGMVQIDQYADRKPNQLSGGQQQRVALARALVIEPDVILLDEPLSNLDAKLRLDMRSQIREICKRAGITGVYVTHDQKEALSMADGIAVLRDGKVMQTGSPRALYEQPRTRFVADFLGETNFVQGEVLGSENGRMVIDTALGRLHSSSYPTDMPTKGNVTCSIRPEAMMLDHRGEWGGSTGENMFGTAQKHVVYLGEMAQYRLLASEQVEMKAFELNPRLMDERAEKLNARVDPADVVVLAD
ncbi:Spermidine/putrescine import ATP-binding protein PotA [Poriferisphaera corsica]|uniref:Spermidine/putrescine import ATP-binding protein PotA n=1 Tax=Poriferisphaera corsica TaxID=2528020 RepID=A0A517YXT1_9BACT|nr:ABC transporter ATP-binding protein [Poriferisphaera corsica]QDU35034.1 Spermidine/putrescine import ATP-binding protein PotA [Poriferisphaera corsica]